jgi:hypothetical protein
MGNLAIVRVSQVVQSIMFDVIVLFRILPPIGGLYLPILGFFFFLI